MLLNRQTGIKWMFFAFFGLSLVHCASTQPPPVTPEGKNVKVSRSHPSPHCQEIGMVEGRTKDIKGAFEEALEDLKSDAARKGANFVRIEQTGAIGKSLRGTAYLCL